MIFGMKSNDNNNNKPWNIAAILVLPPAFTLAELLTITDVIGKPPKKPLIMFPVPCATNSLFVGVTLLIGSILSTASIFFNGNDGIERGLDGR